MNFRDEIRELTQQGVQPDMGEFIDEMEEWLALEATCRDKVVAELRNYISRFRLKKWAYLTLHYEDPSEGEREAISICETWLADNGYDFRKLIGEEEGQEVISIIILIL